MKLIVGLGNPGKKYTRTRHNMGFLVVDELRAKLAESHSISDWQLSKKFNAEVCGTTIGGEKVILAKPMTFMNASGQSVQLIAAFYKMLPSDIIVVHDEKDLVLGTVKHHFDRGHAGHNGIKSIIEYIGTTKFDRIRVGVASENKRRMEDTASFVLSKFGLLERKKVQQTISESVHIITDLL